MPARVGLKPDSPHDEVPHYRSGLASYDFFCPLENYRRFLTRDLFTPNIDDASAPAAAGSTSLCGGVDFNPPRGLNLAAKYPGPCWTKEVPPLCLHGVSR